jgi:hypothetical protein
MASLARQRFRIPLPLALKLPIGVWGQGGTLNRLARKWSDNITGCSNRKKLKYPKN